MFVVGHADRRGASSARRVPTYDRAAWRELQTAALPLGFFLITLNPLHLHRHRYTRHHAHRRGDRLVHGVVPRLRRADVRAVGILAAVLTPRFSQLFVDDPAAHASRCSSGRSLGSAAIGRGDRRRGVVPGRRPMLLLFFGAAYEPAVPPLQILAGGSIFVFCTWILHAGGDRDEPRSASAG